MYLKLESNDHECYAEAKGLTDDIIFEMAVLVSNLLVNLKGDTFKNISDFRLALALNLENDLSK